jgi:hypothetical protein
MARLRVPVQIAAVVLLSACVPAAPITHKTEAIAHIRASQPKTFDAVLDFFATKPWYVVDTTDRSSGLIKVTLPSAGYSPRCFESRAALIASTNDWSPIYEPHYGDQYELAGGSAIPVATEYTITISGDSAGSTVHLAANWIGFNGKTLSCELSHYWDGAFEDAIRGRAEPRAPFWHKAQP